MQLNPSTTTRLSLILVLFHASSLHASSSSGVANLETQPGLLAPLPIFENLSSKSALNNDADNDDDPVAHDARAAFDKLMGETIRATLQDEIVDFVQMLTVKALDKLSPQFPLLFAYEGSRYLCHNIVSGANVSFCLVRKHLFLMLMRA